MTYKNLVPEEVFEDIIKRQQDRVYKLAFTYMKSSYDADDIYQIVFEKYLLYQPEFENEEHEKAWFITTTINTCKNMLTSGWKKKVVVSDEALRDISEIHEAEKDDEQSEKLLAAILKLPEKLAVVIQLFYYEEYSVKQIAEILNIRVGTVTTRLNRARKKLEQSM